MSQCIPCCFFTSREKASGFEESMKYKRLTNAHYQVSTSVALPYGGPLPLTCRANVSAVHVVHFDLCTAVEAGFTVAWAAFVCVRSAAGLQVPVIDIIGHLKLTVVQKFHLYILPCLPFIYSFDRSMLVSKCNWTSLVYSCMARSTL